MKGEVAERENQSNGIGMATEIRTARAEVNRDGLRLRRLRAPRHVRLGALPSFAPDRS